MKSLEVKKKSKLIGFRALIKRELFMSLVDGKIIMIPIVPYGQISFTNTVQTFSSSAYNSNIV